MSLAPAHIRQFQTAQELDDWAIVPDYNHVVKDLQRIDRGLNVRFSRSGKCYAVFHRSHDDCPHNGTIRHGEYLVRSIDARLSPLGVWTGLDERVVVRMLEIMPDGRWGYNLGDELEKARRKREAAQKAAFRERLGALGEVAAFELRKSMGERKNGRIFKPRDIRESGNA